MVLLNLVTLPLTHISSLAMETHPKTWIVISCSSRGFVSYSQDGLFSSTHRWCRILQAPNKLKSTGEQVTGLLGLLVLTSPQTDVDKNWA